MYSWNCNFILLLQTFDRSRKKFLQALVDNLSSRFPEGDLLSAAGALDPANWPNCEDELILYGDSDIALLAKAVGLPVCIILQCS